MDQSWSYIGLSTSLFLYIKTEIAQSAGAVEYTECISVEG